jgi:predicted regulator of Ras-like GTPase activity (Roadblock/LC7/MglB family)
LKEKREAISRLESASLSFLSAIDIDGALDAALFLRRTGSILASWTRQDVPLEILSVMMATMLASIETITETLGGPRWQFVAVDAGPRRIAATRIGSQALLVLIAPKKVSSSYLRNATMDVAARLMAASNRTVRTNRIGERPGVTATTRSKRRP